MRFIIIYLFNDFIIIIHNSEPLSKFHVKRALLLKIYLASDLVFIQDDSEEIQETRRFIERQIAMYNFS